MGPLVFIVDDFVAEDSAEHCFHFGFGASSLGVLLRHRYAPEPALLRYIVLMAQLDAGSLLALTLLPRLPGSSRQLLEVIQGLLRRVHRLTLGLFYSGLVPRGIVLVIREYVLVGFDVLQL